MIEQDLNENSPYLHNYQLTALNLVLAALESFFESLGRAF